jgi:hypothetical protein
MAKEKKVEEAKLEEEAKEEKKSKDLKAEVKKDEKEKAEKKKKATKKGKGKKRNKMIMRPRIDATAFGSITIEGQKIKNDVILRLEGSVQKRKKKLSKKVYGTSHKISLEEARYVYEKGAEILIIGAGQYRRVGLSDEAEKYLNKKGCRVKLLATSKAIQAWNTAGENAIGLFHVAC